MIKTSDRLVIATQPTMSTSVLAIHRFTAMLGRYSLHYAWAMLQPYQRTSSRDPGCT